jgi:hypothetical protein
MSLIYTFRVTPQNTPPYINGAPLENYAYVYGKPQPIKYWRKQYDTSNCSVKIETFKKDTCDGIKVGNKCIGGTQKIKHLGTTNLNKNYYSSTSQYLQSRQKTYNQNQILGQNTKDYTYQSTYDSSGCVTYKPSNLAFKTQGGVSASLTTLKNRNTEITKNSNSFRTPYGLSGANYGQYHGNAPYFIKSKTNICKDCKYIGYVKPIVLL